MFSPELMKFLISYQREEIIESQNSTKKEKKEKKYSVPVFSKRKPIVIPIPISYD